MAALAGDDDGLPARSTAPPVVARDGPPRLAERFGPLRLPWLPLGSFPTPVERLPGLSTELGAEVWVKRDDRSGARYGGNKVRKLELLLADAVARGRRTLVTIGAYGSHHALATAIYGRALGLDVALALYPQPITPHVLDDLLLGQVHGARLVHVRWTALAPLVAVTLAAAADRGELIPPGGSSARGTLGYVEAGLELAGQVARGELPAPDAVVVAAGTCGTAAGLALGLELGGLHASRVVAVRVVPAAVASRPLLRRLDRGARRLLRESGARLPRRRPVEVELDPHELGGGYGVDTPQARDAVARFGAAGLELETTYTGKAAAALVRLAAGPLRGKRLLFWHTLSSVDLRADLARAAPAALPAAFHRALRAGGRL